MGRPKRYEEFAAHCCAKLRRLFKPLGMTRRDAKHEWEMRLGCRPPLRLTGTFRGGELVTGVCIPRDKNHERPTHKEVESCLGVTSYQPISWPLLSTRGTLSACTPRFAGGIRHSTPNISPSLRRPRTCNSSKQDGRELTSGRDSQGAPPRR